MGLAFRNRRDLVGPARRDHHRHRLRALPDLCGGHPDRQPLPGLHDRARHHVPAVRRSDLRRHDEADPRLRPLAPSPPPRPATATFAVTQARNSYFRPHSGPQQLLSPPLRPATATFAPTQARNGYFSRDPVIIEGILPLLGYRTRED